MRPEDRFMFLATRQRLDPDRKAAMLAFVEKHALDWDQVFSTAKEHGIAPLIYTHVSSIPEITAKVPQNVLARYKLYTFNQMVFKRERAKQIINALAYFKDKNIKVILLKGVALGILVYDQPWYTISKDMDLVLSVKKEELSPKQVQDIDTFFHQQTIEYDYFEHHDMSMNGLIPIKFEEIWRRASRITIQEQDAFVLSPEDMLLSICINSCRKRYVNLKSLLDIVETIDRYPAFDWAEFCRSCNLYECANIVYAALLVARSTIGGNIPSSAFAALCSNRVRSATISLCVRILLRITSLRPSSSKTLFNRSIDLSLLLPYATYRPGQIRQKIKWIGANQEKN